MAVLVRAGLAVSVAAVVQRACGCVEDHGIIASWHSDPRAHRKSLIERVLAWHLHESLKEARTLVAGHDPLALHELLKSDELRPRFRPKLLAVCAVDLCGSPYRGLASPHVAGGAPSFAYAGKLITTNKVHGVAQNEPVYVGMGTGSGTHNNYDTALFLPSPEARVTGTATQQVTNSAFSPTPTIYDTEQIVGTITASAARAVTEAGCFDASTAAPATTLSAAVSSATATSISVTAATGFPSSGNYDIEVSDGTHPAETMTVTAGQGTTTWTVTRGARGSTAQAAINSGANVIGGTGTAGGNAYVLADFAVVNLNSGDSIQFTIKLQYT